MPENETTHQATPGEKVFGGFSWPEGKIPQALADKAVPLKVGFIEDVKAVLPGSEHEDVQTAVARWTRRIEYQTALMAPNAQRIDIDGNPAGEVTKTQRAHAEYAIRSKQMSRARKEHGEVTSALDAIDKMFDEPTRENLKNAREASKTIRRILTRT